MKIKLSLIYLLLIYFNYSCSPKMHLIGVGMRALNMSQNKYSKKNPYLKTKSEKEKDTTSKTH